jgi:hypothetical protein
MKQLLVCLLFLAPVCLAQEILQASSLGPVTMSELAKRSYPPPLPLEVEHEGRWRKPEHTPLPTSTAWNFEPAAATITAPPVATRFPSAGSASIGPGDAAGAVSQNYVVTATNIGIIVHSRTGAQLSAVPLNVFLSDVAGGDSGIYTDPRIAYDATVERWIVFGLRIPSNPIIAVSHTGDPRGQWTRYRIDGTKFANFVDFTRIALTRDTIVAVTYEADTGASYPLSFLKSDLYSLPSSVPFKVYLAGYNVAPVWGEESPIEYILSEGINDGLLIRRLDAPTSKSVSNPYSWGRAETPAPQLGTASRFIDTGFYDLEAAVMRGGIIYAVNTLSATNPTRTSLLWWKFDAETGARLGGGMIDDAAGGKYYAYPSLAVNRAGAVLIAFNTFSATQRPSIGYIYIDPSGAISTEGVLKTGESGTSARRWGDYSTTIVDPGDDSSFWTIQEATAENHWVAWWGKITIKGKTRAARH